MRDSFFIINTEDLPDQAMTDTNCPAEGGQIPETETPVTANSNNNGGYNGS